MALALTIDGVDRTRLVRENGFIIENILTRQVDRCSFIIGKAEGSSTLNFKPAAGREVVITNNGTKIFGGVIIRVSQQLDSYGLLNFTVDCEDYTRLLDRKRVITSYENMTINEIITDINTNYLEGFTIANVDAPITVKYIAFNYLPVSKVLTELADRINYDWYVDYDKDIHFFSKTKNTAPYDLEDDTGTYWTDTLKIDRDNTQVRNVVYVRGGEYLGNTFTTEIECDGIRNNFDIPYRYKDLSVTTSAEGTPNPLTVGIDYIDNEDNYDVLWNFQEKRIKFKDADTPTSGNVLRIGGRPYLPVIVKMRNQISIDAMVSAEGGSGEYEFLVVDKTIDSKEGARERGRAELEAYKSTLSEATFQTTKDGFVSGQRLRINSTIHDIDEYFIINRVTSKIFANNQLIYDISVVTTRTFGIIEYLQKFLIDETKKIEINPDEVLDIVEDANETITLSDAIQWLLAHNAQTEAFELSTTFTASPLNFETEFVVGEYAPTGKAGRITNDANTTAGWYMIGAADSTAKKADIKSSYPLREIINLSAATGINWTSNGAYQLTAASSEYLLVQDTSVNFGNTHSADFEKDDPDSMSRSGATSTTLAISGDITIEAWMKGESIGAGSGYSIISRQGSSSNYAWWFQYNGDSGGKLQFVISDDGTTQEVYGSSSGLEATYTMTGQWHHVAVAWDASASSARFYIDGEYINTATGSMTNINVPVNSTLEIGRMNGVNPFDGLLDEIRVWSVCRTDAEIKAHYDSELTDAPNTKIEGYWKLNNSLADTTANGNDLTNNGAVFVTDYPDFLNPFPIGGGDITLVGWFKFDSLGSSYQTLMSKWDPSPDDRSFSFQYDETNDKLQLLVSSTGVNSETYDSSALSLETDIWYHLAVAWDASASTAYFYKNGSAAGSETLALTSMFDSDAHLIIGARDHASGPENFFNGQLASCAIHNTLRSASDIETDYNKNKRQFLIGGSELG